jgi:hypothetical protein
MYFECRTSSVNNNTTTHCVPCGKKVGAITNIIRVASSFAHDSHKIHNNKYIYDLVEYINSYTAVKIICPIHGVFEQRPDNHKSGKGCPKCALYGFQKSKPAILYYLRITLVDQVLYKIGITNRTVNDRFSVEDLKFIEILYTKNYDSGEDCYSEEQRILKQFEEFKYKGAPVLTSGNTELFTKDVFNS